MIAGVDDALAAATAAARAAWPDVHVGDATFAAFVAARLPPALAPAAALAALRTSDLYLACACAAGDAAALRAFDRVYLPMVDRAIRGAGASAAESADVQQEVRRRLLVPRAPGDAPPIATYSGRGTLAAWVRIVGKREAARLLPRARRERPTDRPDVPGRDAGPELAYLKRLYRADFRAAVAAAVAALTDRQRTLLRRSAIDGDSIDVLAAAHGVHRATAARWIEDARAALLDGTRAALLARLRVAPDELASILRLVQSQVEVSLPRLLAPGAPR